MLELVVEYEQLLSASSMLMQQIDAERRRRGVKGKHSDSFDYSSYEDVEEEGAPPFPPPGAPSWRGSSMPGVELRAVDDTLAMVVRGPLLVPTPVWTNSGSISSMQMQERRALPPVPAVHPEHQVRVLLAQQSTAAMLEEPEDMKRSTSEIRLPGFRHSVSDLGVEGSLHLAVEEEDRADCYVVNPGNIFRMLWDLLLILALLFELWSTPFAIIFLNDDSVPRIFPIMSHVITAYFGADILLNFNTGFYDKDKIVMSRKAIAKKYLQFWFWLDFLTTIPFDLVASSIAGGLVRLLRFGKVLKLTKALRVVKLAKTLRSLVKLGNLQFSLRLRYLITPAQAMFVLVVAAHVFGCVWASLRLDWDEGDEIDLALRRYYESLRWAYIALTTGTLDLPEEDVMGEASQWTLDIGIATVRLFFLAFIGMWGLFVAQCGFQDDVRLMQLKEDAMRYMKRHKVSLATRIQILYILQETGHARNRQRHFRELMEHDLPREVQTKICKELWSDRLMSLGLIAPIARMHTKFMEELSVLVREDFLASDVVVFRYGDTSHAAYNIVDGKLRATDTTADSYIPLFLVGHWVGEAALVNPFLRRTLSVLTVTTASLMRVPAEEFQEVLSRLGLSSAFKALCKEHLWQGLCGRCGMLGDHFTNACPELGLPVSASENGYTSGGQPSRNQTSSSTFYARRKSTLRKQSTVEGNPNKEALKGELITFLHQCGLQRISQSLLQRGCRMLDDLQKMDMELLQAEEGLTDSEVHLLSPAAVERFREKIVSAVQRLEFDKISKEDHFVFLSHCKSEAGTEAALLRTELESLLGESPAIKAAFSVPVFLDSDDLMELNGVKAAVKRSHNLAVLLTNGVLSRPWVLIEIVTAVESGVRVLPVQICKPGTTFVFPDEAFYRRLFTGDFLTLDDRKMLHSAGISIKQVESAIRALFNHIAVSYSPHKAGEFRQVEVKALMRRCRPKQAANNPHSPLDHLESATSDLDGTRHTARRSSDGSTARPMDRGISPQ